jgi:hypothetical protein
VETPKTLASALAEVNKKFDTYRCMLQAVANANIKHAIVWGPPGIGKSYELEEVFNKYRAADQINWTSSSGHVTACSLYNMLYEMRGPDDICVFDDCDDVFRDRTAMNILKAATDTRPNRRIAWESTGGKPTVSHFDYEGRVVVLSNADFSKNAHLQALVDRMFFIPLQLNVTERVARVVSVLTEPKPGKVIHPKADLVAGWVITNHEALGSKLTLRTAVKALQLAEFTEDWERMASMTVGL